MNFELGRKGLAATAVGALAVSGLTIGLPSTAIAADEPGVLLISPFNTGHDVSVRVDRSGEPAEASSVELTALRTDPSATISFEYNQDPEATSDAAGWTAIGPMTQIGDYATVVWNPPGNLVGTSVSLRAVADVEDKLSFSAMQHVAITGSGPHAVNLQQAPNTGFFFQPYADSGRTSTLLGVRGSTSATEGSVEVSWWRPSDQTFQGRVDAEVSGTTFKIIDLSNPAPPPPVPGGSFAAALDITPFDAAHGDVIAIGAERDTDALVPTMLYKQSVGRIEASSEPVREGEGATVSLRVFDDEEGGLIAGAEVHRLSDGALVGYTDGRGEVQVKQEAGQSDTYYVNTTDTDAYEDGTDPSVAHEPAIYEPEAIYAEAVSSDGEVFDDDEYAPGDLYVQVYDQQNRPMTEGVEVSYQLYPTDSTPPPAETAITDADGQAPMVFAPEGPDGDYTVDYALASDPGDPYDFEFTAGDATLDLTPVRGVVAPGGQITFDGELTVAGEPLPGRRVRLDYKRGIELVPGRDADAALVEDSVRALTRSVTTDAAGTFIVVVDDLAEKPQGAETGGQLTATTLGAPSGATLTGNPDESAAASAQFGSTRGKVRLTLKGKAAGNKFDKLIAKGPSSLRGERVKLFRIVAGKLKLVKKTKLNSGGDIRVKVKDLNGNRTTKYIVKLLSSKRVRGSKSKPTSVR